MNIINMSATSIIIVRAAGEFLLLVALALLPSVSVYIDVGVIGAGVGELSVTEITQEALILTTALITWYGAWRHPDRRGLLVLMAGFFSCIFIRELDSFLDYVWHGFWFWPAILMASASITYVVVFCRNTVIGPLSNFVATRSYFFILVGMISLLVFSRTFGSGNLLWIEVMGEAYNHAFKSALQEGLELYGYLFIAYGTFKLWIKDFDSPSFAIDRLKNAQQKHAADGDARR